METIKELNSKILQLTLLIQNKYPELSKYLGEMRETLPDVENPEMDIATLKEYAESLEMLIAGYSDQHPG